MRSVVLLLLVLTILAGFCGNGTDCASGVPEIMAGERPPTVDHAHVKVTGELSILGGALMRPGSAGGGTGAAARRGLAEGAPVVIAAQVEGHIARVGGSRVRSTVAALTRPPARAFSLPLLI